VSQTVAMVLAIAAVYGSHSAATIWYHTAPHKPISRPTIGKYAKARIRYAGWWSASVPHGSRVRNITQVKNVRLSDSNNRFESYVSPFSCSSSPP
jgi:hypothetical protein